MKVLIRIVLCFLFLGKNLFASPLDNPLAHKADLLGNYLGSFSFFLDEGGNNSIAYQRGRIAVNAGATKFYSDSHPYENKVAEFAVPSTLGSGTASSLPLAPSTQGFASLFDRADSSAPGWNGIGGMAVIDGQLVVQGALWYDTTDTKETTLVIRNSSNLAGNIDGYFSMNGGSRTVNYISPIPLEWQSILGGTHIVGNGLGMSIAGRLSLGPSLYTFNKADLSGRTSGSVTTKAWLSYDTTHALSSSTSLAYPSPGIWDEYNQQGLNSGFTKKNDMWTWGSAAWYGFIIPGTRTFAVIGQSGMHNSGGAYKVTQTDGYLCGGPCAYSPDDYQAYFWLYDLADIINATHTYDPVPYEYGPFDHLYELGKNQDSLPSAASYDPTTGKLFILLQAAYQYNAYVKAPIVNVYQLGKPAPQPVILDITQ